MIVASCPLRISLVGGSTDHPDFIKKYKRGSVISFPSNLRVYTSFHRDVDGLNHHGKYVVNYTHREEVSNLSEIRNDIVKETIDFWDGHIAAPCSVSLTSDVSSIGSGLASSSAYIMALSKALRPGLDNTHIARKSLEIERRINPYVGAQDFYASAIGGLKRINFYEENQKSYTFNNLLLFTKFSMYLVPTEIRRESKNILKHIDIDKCLPLLDDVEELEYAIDHDDDKAFYSVINQSWKNKKATSSEILKDEKLIKIEQDLLSYPIIKALKLCGAGNGGYFLIFIENDTSYGNALKAIEQKKELYQKYNLIDIKISQRGLDVIKV